MELFENLKYIKESVELNSEFDQVDSDEYVATLSNEYGEVYIEVKYDFDNYFNNAAYVVQVTTEDSRFAKIFKESDYNDNIDDPDYVDFDMKDDANKLANDILQDYNNSLSDYDILQKYNMNWN